MDFSKTNYFQDKLLDALFRGISYSVPELGIGLVTVTPTESMSGVTELYSGVAGTTTHQGYQRFAASGKFTSAPAAPASGTGRQITSTQAMIWTPVGDSWSLNGLVGWDATTRNTGNALIYFPLPSAQPVVDGQSYSVPLGGWTHLED